MKNHNYSYQTYFFVALILFVFSAHRKAIAQESSNSTVVLSNDWKMQPIDKLKKINDATISQNKFDTTNWYKAMVPGTILGSMATTGIIEDPYFGVNMQNVSYEQFKQPWWFRTSFTLKKEELNKTVALRFNGINYRADLWVNGKKVVGKETFAGTYRRIC